MSSLHNWSYLKDVLLRWQHLHRTLVGEAASRDLASWEPALRLIESAFKVDEAARRHLKKAIAKSGKELAPWGDPLDLNLGGHRWLADDREESYSDWLAWILQGIHANEILRLFKLGDGVPIGALGKLESINREEISKQGRTDIVVRFGGGGLLLIEVKTKPFSKELRGQLDRYRESATGQPSLFALVALEEPEAELSGFRFTPWSVLSKRLRRHACHAEDSDRLRAAVVLAFCGAVEQNLLGVSADPAPFRARGSLDYLETWRDEE